MAKPKPPVFLYLSVASIFFCALVAAQSSFNQPSAQTLRDRIEVDSQRLTAVEQNVGGIVSAKLPERMAVVETKIADIDDKLHEVNWLTRGMALAFLGVLGDMIRRNMRTGIKA